MLNTEYVIIPVCLPENPNDYLKVSRIPIPIHTFDDKTGRRIDTMLAEQEAMKNAASIYNWTGKLSLVYGYGTAGGIGNKKSAVKANERLISKLEQFTKAEFMSSKY